MLSTRNADYMGFSDRGRIAVGQKADINIIDLDNLRGGWLELREWRLVSLSKHLIVRVAARPNA